MARRETMGLGLAAALVALGLATGAAAEGDRRSGQTIARLVSAERGIVSLGGDACTVTRSTVVRDAEGRAMALADLSTSGSPAYYEAHGSGDACTLELLEIVEKLPE